MYTASRGGQWNIPTDNEGNAMKSLEIEGTGNVGAGVVKELQKRKGHSPASLRKENMTNNEKELVAALEGDIHFWEPGIQFFETFSGTLSLSEDREVPAREYARRLRLRIAEHWRLIDAVKKRWSCSTIGKV
jgi:hypothetical protein